MTKQLDDFLQILAELVRCLALTVSARETRHPPDVQPGLGVTLHDGGTGLHPRRAFLDGTMPRVGCGTAGWMQPFDCIHPRIRAEVPDYFASASGRIWKCTTLLGVPAPVSAWNGARVLQVAQTPRPFQPRSASSMRPSIHLV